MYELAIVIVPSGGDILEAARRLLDAHTYDENATKRRNRSAKCDFYVLGGMFERLLEKVKRPRADEDELITYATCAVRSLPAVMGTSVPSAIVTPDGTWREMPLSALTSLAASRRWTSTFEKIVALYPDHTAVGVDYHL